MYYIILNRITLMHDAVSSGILQLASGKNEFIYHNIVLPRLSAPESIIIIVQWYHPLPTLSLKE